MATPSPLVAAIAAWGLSTGHRLPTAPLDDDQFTDLLATAERERVLGLLGAATRDAAFPVTDGQRARLEARWQAWCAHALRVEQVAGVCVAELSRAGIRSVVLKGVALAHSAYPDPAQRVFGDADLLVAPHTFSRAARVLEEALGGSRALPELRPGFDDRFGREILLRVRGVEIDLHRTFVDGPFGLTLHPEDCFAAPVPFTAGGQTLARLAPGPRLLHAAYAATLSDWPPRLVAARDLVQVLAADTPALDEVLGLARRWRAEAVLATGTRWAWRSLQLTGRCALLDWADRFRPSRRDRWLMASYHGRARGYTRQLGSLLALAGWRDRTAYLRALAFPQPEYRAARRLGWSGLLGAGLRRARGT